MRLEEEKNNMFYPISLRDNNKVYKLVQILFYKLIL